MKALREALTAAVALVAVGFVSVGEAAEFWRIPVFPPKPQSGYGSQLRLVNPHQSSTSVLIYGRDSEGERYPAEGAYEVAIPAFGNVRIPVEDIESEIGNGEGWWTLFLEAARLVDVVPIGIRFESAFVLPVVRKQDNVPLAPDLPDLYIHDAIFFPNDGYDPALGHELGTWRVLVVNRGQASSIPATLRILVDGQRTIAERAIPALPARGGRVQFMGVVPAWVVSTMLITYCINEACGGS